MQGWQARIATFLVANLVIVPLAGRLSWLAMEGLNDTGSRFAAVFLSVLVAAAIMTVNVWLIRRAVLAGMPKIGEMLGFGAAGLQFVATIGTGFFSLVNLALALLN